MLFIVTVIHRVSQLIIIVVIVQTFLTYFLSPFHPVRQMIDRFVNPMLAPIRRVLPQTGPLDFSPLVLIILVQILDTILTSILLRL
jgi:YggT family protein